MRSQSFESPEVWFANAERARKRALAEAEEESEEIHLKQITRTKLEDGKLSILVDLGSRVNCIGADTCREFTDVINAAGKNAEFVNRESRLNINGVGSGSAPCDEEAILPVAIKFGEGPATLEKFRANVAEGSGAHLPAIWGSKSMQEKDAVLILRQGKEMVALPGPGGYKIEWSPGTRILPMTAAPSGHLVIPCDRFSEIQQSKPTLDEAQTVFVMDMTQPK